MVAGIILFIIAIVAVVISPNSKDSLILYYDAKDVLPDGTVSSASTEEEESPGMHITVGDATVTPKMRGGDTPAAVEDLRQVVAEEDPVQVASDTFDELRRNGL